MTTEEPITDGLHHDYVKEEVAKLMVYKVQAYEQLAEIDRLKEQLKQERNKAIEVMIDEFNRIGGSWSANQIVNKLQSHKSMKTLKKVPISLVDVDFIPEQFDMEIGKFYYSEKYRTGSHICPCGCGQEFSVPIKDGEWSILDVINLTIQPSFQHRIKCKAHYVIQNGYVNIISEGLAKSSWFERFGLDDFQPGE